MVDRGNVVYFLSGFAVLLFVCFLCLCVFSPMYAGSMGTPARTLRGGFAPPRYPLCAVRRPLRAFSAVYRATGGYAPLAYNYSLARDISGLFCSLTKSPFCAIALCWLPPPVVVEISVSAWEASFAFTQKYFDFV